MAGFLFRLERVLALRRIAEDTAGREVFRALELVATQERKVCSLRAEETRLRQVKKEICHHSVDVQHLVYVERTLGAIARKLTAECGTLKELIAQSEVRRQDRIKASQRVRVLENLRERRQAEWAVKTEAALRA